MRNFLNNLSCCFSIFVIIVVCFGLFIFIFFRNTWIESKHDIVFDKSKINQAKLWMHQNQDNNVFPKYLMQGVTSLAKPTAPIENPNCLVFSGGGARGPAYAGILKYLLEKNMLKSIDSFIGTSAGSIMCTFISLGSYYENNRKTSDLSYWSLVNQIIEKTNFIDFIDNDQLRKIIKDKSFDTDNVFTSIQSAYLDMKYQYALCNGKRIEKFFGDSLEKFGLDRNITLAELHKKTSKHLILVSCSLSYGKTAYFDYKTAPDMKVIKAIRASMAIPLVFAPVKYNNDFFVDGGAANNYPVNFFDTGQNYDKNMPKVLGFALFSKKELLRPPWKKVGNFIEFSDALSQLVMFNTNRALNPENFKRTVFIDCGKIGVMTFNIDKGQKEELIQSGYNSIRNYYKTKK